VPLRCECGPIAPVLRLLSEGKIETSSMIEGSYTLCEGTAAFKPAARPGVRKILLKP
jgi:hypothetical protein